MSNGQDFDTVSFEEPWIQLIERSALPPGQRQPTTVERANSMNYLTR